MPLGKLAGVTFAVFIGAACSHRAPEIPNKVSNDEYIVYAAWITHHFKEQPARLLLETRTFTFDPVGSHFCNPALLESQGHVDRALLQALYGIGEAEYPIHTEQFRVQPSKIPWQFQEYEGLMTNPPHPFRLIRFSRVAFNADRSQALFAISNSCGGLCGGGGALLATRRNGRWDFHPISECTWVY